MSGSRPLRKVVERLVQLLGAHCIVQHDAAQNLRREIRDAGELQRSPSVKLSPTCRVPWFGTPMMSPGNASSRVFALLREEEDRRRDIHRLSFAHVEQPHAARNFPEQSRTNAMRSRWFGSMLACTLKTKPVTGSRRLDARVGRLARQRVGAQRVRQVEQLGNAEILQRAAEDHR